MVLSMAALTDCAPDGDLSLRYESNRLQVGDARVRCRRTFISRARKNAATRSSLANSPRRPEPDLPRRRHASPRPRITGSSAFAAIVRMSSATSSCSVSGNSRAVAWRFSSSFVMFGIRFWRLVQIVYRSYLSLTSRSRRRTPQPEAHDRLISVCGDSIAVPAMSRCAQGVSLTKRLMNWAPVIEPAVAAAGVLHVGELGVDQLVVVRAERHPPDQLAGRLAGREQRVRRARRRWRTARHGDGRARR